jgi:hypothetical protein
MQTKNVSKVFIGTILVLMAVSTLLLLIQTAAAEAPQLPNNSCADCHRKLIFTSETQRQFVEIRIKHLESGISCSIVCHEDKLNKTTASTYAMWSVSMHALFQVTCDNCHGGNAQATSKKDAHAGISEASIARANTPEMCGKCHESELDEFKGSKHYKKLESGEEGPAPACITCHQAHSVRVLTASEIEDFCSNCHNRITGIDPSVPEKAEQALASINELQVELSKARTAIISAKAAGKDVTESEAELEAARGILKHIPSVWHRFNLTFFDTEVQQGITDAKKAEMITAETSPSPTTKAPGFEVYLFILSLISVYLLKKH